MKNIIKMIKQQFLSIKKRLTHKRKKKQEEQLKTSGLRLIEVATIVGVATFIGIFGGSYFTYSYLDDKQTEEENRIQVLNDELEEIVEVYQDINENYYDEVDRQELIDAAIEGMISALDDPYASYLNEAEKTQFDERMNGEYKGVGIELLDSNDNKIIIMDVFEGSPAARAGLEAGDIIIEVDGENISGMDSAMFAEYIKGSDKALFTIKVNRTGELLTFNLEKENVVLKSITTKTFERDNKKIGYIDVSLFANNTYKQFKEAVETLEQDKIDALIIDVRDNSGGYLHITTEMLSLFFEKDTIIYQLETKSEVERYYDNTKTRRTYPVAVLINNDSASASEIVAAAFKENYSAEIIGQTSFGKGTVQQTQDTGAGTMIKFTVQRWLTPSGECIEGKGVEPTISVILDEEYYINPGDDTDNQLQKALEILAK